MSQNSARWYSRIATAMAASFCILGVFSMVDSRYETIRAKHRAQLTQLDFSNIAREDLPRPVEPFPNDIQLTNGNLPLDNNLSVPGRSESNATSNPKRLQRLEDQKEKAEERLGAATKRVKLLDAQRRELDRHFQQRSNWTHLVMMGSLIGYVVFSRLNKEGKQLAEG